MKLILSAIGSFVFALIAAFFYVTSQDVPGLSVNAASAFFSDRKNTSLRVFFKVDNQGSPDVLLSANSDYAKAVSIARPKGFSDTATAIPASSTPVFSLDSVFLELIGVRNDLGIGDLVPVTLLFQEAGEVRFKAIVSDVDHSAMVHSMHAAGAMNASMPVPRVALSVARSAEDDGWHVAVSTTDFTFMDAPAGTPHVQGEGHAHVYLNGLKLQRLYGDQASIGELLPGAYTVSVTLNTNSHSAYMNKGKTVTALGNIYSE